MVTRTRASRLGTIGIGAVLVVGGIVGLLVVGVGRESAVAMLRTGFLAVVYVAVPVVLVVGLLGVYFKFNAWRQ